MMSRWRFDMRTHLAGSGATSEEQLDERRKNEQIEREAPNTSASSDPCVAQEYPVRGETPSRPGSVLVQKSGRVHDDMRITALDVPFHRKPIRTISGGFGIN